METIHTKTMIVLAASFLFAISVFALSPGAALASDRFTNNEDGALTDTQTGLIWTATDQAQDMSWVMADFLCSQLEMRMPSMDELAGLYNADVVNPTEPSEGCAGGYHIDDAFNITCGQFWALETNGFEAGFVSFEDGRKYFTRYEMFSGRRAFCVTD